MLTWDYMRHAWLTMHRFYDLPEKPLDFMHQTKALKVRKMGGVKGIRLKEPNPISQRRI